MLGYRGRPAYRGEPRTPREPDRAPMNPNITCVITKQGAFIVGDTLTGLTHYSYPDSPNAVRAWALRGHHADLVKHASNVLREAGRTSAAIHRSLRDHADYHARNWVVLNEDPRKWGLPLPPKTATETHPPCIKPGVERIGNITAVTHVLESDGAGFPGGIAVDLYEH